MPFHANVLEPKSWAGGATQDSQEAKLLCMWKHYSLNIPAEPLQHDPLSSQYLWEDQ